MDTERAPLSCPGRVQNWLGTAVDQIETLLQVSMPSLSGSDQWIGALRIERERASRKTGPYNLRPKNVLSGASPENGSVSLSLSPNRSLGTGKSDSRCENCVAEKGSRCSRDLPSCSRCRKSGMFCFYAEGAPTGRRKPPRRGLRRDRVEERDSQLPAESLAAAPVSEGPSILEVGGTLAAQLFRSETHPLHAISESARLPEDRFAIFPDTSTPDTLLWRTSKLETAREIAEWGKEQGALENALRERIDNEIRNHPVDLADLPLRNQLPLEKQPDAVSSLATTPFSSTLASRSTSQSSGTDSLPITPGIELPTPLDGSGSQQAIRPRISASRAPSVSNTTSSAYDGTSVTEDGEVRVSHVEEFVDLYFRGTESSVDPQDRSFSDRFLEELFEEGDAAKELIRLQGPYPKKREVRCGP